MIQMDLFLCVFFFLMLSVNCENGIASIMAEQQKISDNRNYHEFVSIIYCAK